jgi:hypothetical protein
MELAFTFLSLNLTAPAKQEGNGKKGWGNGRMEQWKIGALE